MGISKLSPASSRWVGLGGWLALSLLVALTGMIFQPGAWYSHLAKPAWTPPDWLFPPAWTLLYTLMAVAAWLVWQRAGFAGARLALGLYLLQLAFNAAWSWLVFGLRRLDLGLVDVTLMWLAIAATILAFWRIHRMAALLLAPYLVWVTYAAALNLALWRMNA